MNGQTIPIVAAIVLQSALALGVFLTNPRRRSNQSFLFLSIAAVGWLFALYYGSTATDLSLVTWWMREAFVAGILVLSSLNLLRLSIGERQNQWSAILYRARLWLIVAAGMIVFCQTKFFLQGAQLIYPVGTAPPRPLYGSGAWIYMVYFALAIVVLIFHSSRDLKRTTGGEHVALAFLAIGGVFVIAFPIVLSLALRLFVEPSRLLWFAPFRVLLFSLVVAYGIATRKVIEVGFFLRRLMSYVVLAAYLLALYALVWWLVAAAMAPLRGDHRTIAHIAAALVITFAMAPARGISQSFADKLFVGTRGIDFRATVSKAAAILESVTTLPDLLRRFATTIGEAVGTDSVTIFLESRRGFTQRYSNAHDGRIEAQPEIAPDSPLINWLTRNREPLILDELHRVRETASTNA